MSETAVSSISLENIKEWHIYKRIITKVCSLIASPVLGANLSTFMMMLSSTPSVHPFILNTYIYMTTLTASVILPYIKQISSSYVTILSSGQALYYRVKRSTVMEVKAQQKEKKKKKEVHLAKGKHFSRSDNCTLKLSVSLSCLLRNPRVTKTGVIIYIADILSSVR